MRCPYCKSGLTLECYEQIWTKQGDVWNITYYCEGCGNEFDKPEDQLVPKAMNT